MSLSLVQADLEILAERLRVDRGDKSARNIFLCKIVLFKRLYRQLVHQRSFLSFCIHIIRSRQASIISCAGVTVLFDVVSGDFASSAPSLTTVARMINSRTSTGIGYRLSRIKI